LVFALLCAIAPLASMANNWTVRGVPVEVSRCPKGYCLVSTPCVSGAQPNCRALEVMNNRVVADSGPGGTNPGSGVCQTKLNGSVFVAKDSSGNEVAFCRFADGSFLSLDGLWRW
jgi:hypothetical protein